VSTADEQLAAAGAARNPAGKGAHLLVVDDDVDLLRLLSMRLTANGYRVTGVGSAEAALPTPVTR